MTSVLIGLHAAAVIGLAVYGLLGFFTLFLFLRYRRVQTVTAPTAWDELPVVTVQLPIYNARDVAERLILPAAESHYP
ncbi:MAG TPA: glycosyl transferase family 2, partial [Promineifilum sp.]|nr:glycosyl transferase family 2 [Promineifilum sp.]